MGKAKTRPAWSLTTSGAARLIGCSAAKVARLYDSGDLPGWRDGRRRNFNRADVVAYCAAAGVRGQQGVLLCSGPALAVALAGKVPHLLPAGCLGHAGQLHAAGPCPAWVALDLSHCDRAEALAWAWHLKRASRSRVLLLLPDGESLTALPPADCVLCWPHDPAVIAQEVSR